MQSPLMWIVTRRRRSEDRTEEVQNSEETTQDEVTADETLPISNERHSKIISVILIIGLLLCLIAYIMGKSQ